TAAVRLDLAGVVAGLADAAEHRRVVVDLDRRGALRGDDVAGQRTAGAVGGRVATGLDVLRGAVAAGGGVAADAAGVVGDLDRQHVVDVDHVARQRAAGTVGDDALTALVGLLAVAAGHLGVAEQRDRVVGDLDRHDDVEAAAVTAEHLTLGGRLAAGGLLRFRGSLLRLGRRSVGRLLLHRFGRLGGLLGRLLHALGAGELGTVQLGRCALELVGDRLGADGLVDLGEVLLPERRADRVVADLDRHGQRDVQRAGRLVRVDVLLGRRDAGTQHQQ